MQTNNPAGQKSIIETSNNIYPLPQMAIAELHFNSGQPVQFDPKDIIVLTGPNNAGKTLALKEIYASFTNGASMPTHRIVKGITRIKPQAPDELKQSLRHHCQVIKGNVEYIPNGAYNLSLDNFVSLPTTGPIQGFMSSGMDIFVSFLELENRLRLVEENSLPPAYPARATTATQQIFRSREKERAVSEAFKLAFNLDFVVNRSAGAELQFRCGTRPSKDDGEDEYEASFQKKMLSLDLVSAQGHGVKAFAGILMQVLGQPTALILIDEPEAYLHPPQAYLLGRWLSLNKSKETQIVVASHSADFIRGLLDGAETRVRLLRLTRNGNINPVKELRNDDLRAIWADPILRYSNAIDGLFHTKVVVCEADADCKFYSAFTNKLCSTEEVQQILYIPTFTKDRLAVPAEALKPMGVNVIVIADIDILRPASRKTLTRLMSALQVNATEVEKDLNVICDQIEPETQIPMQSAEVVFLAIETIISAARNSGVFRLNEDTRQRIKLALREESPWEDVKRTGTTWFKGSAVDSFHRVDAALRKMGIFVVPVGTLEGFAPGVGGHGPKWLVEVLKRDLDGPDFRIAKEFVDSIFSHKLSSA